MLPRPNLEAIGAVGANLQAVSFGIQLGRLAGVLNLGKPLYNEKTIYI